MHDFATDPQPVVAFTDAAHRLFGFDAGTLPGARVGATPYGNLTIALLPTPKLEHVLRMLDAVAANIPAFGGQLLLLDGPADAARVDAISRSAQARWPDRWLHLPGTSESSGPAAKNAALRHADRSWVMLVDPRVILQWNPLEHAEDDVIRSGAQILNLPRITHEGHFVSADHISLRRDAHGVRLLVQSRVRAAVHERGANTFGYCTAIDSSSLLARVDLLRELGGFDESKADGEDDLDLSLRIFRRGLKVATSSALAFFDDARNTDREQVAQAVVVRGVEDYRAHTAPYGLEQLASIGSATRGCAAAAKARPRIALVIDVDHWAFGNIARQVCRYLSDRFEFRVIPIGIVSNVNQVLLLAQDCELIHFFWREDILQVGAEHWRRYAERLGMSWAQFEQRFILPKAITTSIYDHLMQDEASLRERRDPYRALAGYTVSSDKLLAFYRLRPEFPAPWGTTEDGVDLTLFRPSNLDRLAQAGTRELVVGWAGNSRWESRTEDYKGLHTMLQPAVDELVAEGYRIRIALADRQVRLIPHHEMPAYYASIDLYACPSKIEGTPNPVLESMACGVPVVSTDVGIVPQAFGPKQRQFILPERSKDCLKERLRSLLDAPQQLLELSAENLESIQAWDWSIKVENFARFFADVIDARARARKAA